MLSESEARQIYAHIVELKQISERKDAIIDELCSYVKKLQFENSQLQKQLIAGKKVNPFIDF